MNTNDFRLDWISLGEVWWLGSPKIQCIMVTKKLVLLLFKTYKPFFALYAGEGKFNVEAKG